MCNFICVILHMCNIFMGKSPLDQAVDNIRIQYFEAPRVPQEFLSLEGWKTYWCRTLEGARSWKTYWCRTLEGASKLLDLSDTWGHAYRWHDVISPGIDMEDIYYSLTFTRNRIFSRWLVRFRFSSMRSDFQIFRVLDTDTNKDSWYQMLTRLYYTSSIFQVDRKCRQRMRQVPFYWN